jgi:hypothetical protein
MNNDPTTPSDSKSEVYTRLSELAELVPEVRAERADTNP